MGMREGQQAVTPRFDGVDVLRGFSILSVVLLHTWIRMHFPGSPIYHEMRGQLAHLLLRNGDNGVTVFFAVSGFLITLTSLRRFGSLAQIRPMAFYRIRFARIAPLLLLLLAVLSVLHLGNVEGFRIPAKTTTLPHALFAALTFHLNWLEAVHGYLPANWDVLWSLSVEEMFYLFFPLVCVVLFRLRRGMPLFVALLLVFAAMGPFARTVWTTNPIWQEKTYLGGMDGIALGCLCALVTDVLLRRSEERRKAWSIRVGRDRSCWRCDDPVDCGVAAVALDAVCGAQRSGWNGARGWGLSGDGGLGGARTRGELVDCADSLVWAAQL